MAYLKSFDFNTLKKSHGKGTDRQTNRQTDRQTSRLLDRIGPVGPVGPVGRFGEKHEYVNIHRGSVGHSNIHLAVHPRVPEPTANSPRPQHYTCHMNLFQRLFIKGNRIPLSLAQILMQIILVPNFLKLNSDRFFFYSNKTIRLCNVISYFLLTQKK